VQGGRGEEAVPKKRTDLTGKTTTSQKKKKGKTKIHFARVERKVEGSQE